MKYVVKSTGGGRALGGDFKGTNTGLGNVKGAITGTCRSIDIRHTPPRYLAGYEWRFDRRFDLPKNLERLARFAVAAVRQRKAAGVPGVEGSARRAPPTDDMPPRLCSGDMG